MANLEVLDGPDTGSTATARVSSDDAHAEALAQMLLWLIPVLAFLAAILR
jgi:hypothetical protein